MYLYIHVCTNTPLFHSTMLNDVIVHVYVIDVGMNVIFHSHVLQRQANMILYHIFSASMVLQLKESRLMRSYIHANLAIHNITHTYVLTACTHTITTHYSSCQGWASILFTFLFLFIFLFFSFSIFLKLHVHYYVCVFQDYING